MIRAGKKSLLSWSLHASSVTDTINVRINANGRILRGMGQAAIKKKKKVCWSGPHCPGDISDISEVEEVSHSSM